MKFLHAGMVVASFMLLGRLTGFLREIIIAHVGGASQQSDAMIVLLTFPDMMISLLLGGGLMAALVPRFRNLPAALGVALLLRVGLGIFVGFAALAVVFMIWDDMVLSVIAPGWDAPTVERMAPMLRFALIALPVTALSGVCVAFLNSQERFAYGAVGTLVFNLILIAVLLAFGWLSPIEAIVVGIVGGAVIRLIVQLSAIGPLWVRPDFGSADGRGSLMRDFAASFGFYSILALLPPLLRAFASLIEPGALSLFNYAHKLMELPMAIIVTAVTTVLLPRLSGLVSNGERNGAIEQLSLALRAVIVLLAGVFSVGFFNADAIVQTVFFGASLSEQQFDVLSEVVALGFAAIPFQGVVLLCGTAFVSYGRTMTLLRVAVLMVGVMTGSGIVLQAQWGLKGLMGAYVLVQVLGACLLMWRLVALVGGEVIENALDRFAVSLAFPIILCLVLGWGGRQLDLPTIVVLLISGIVFISIHLWADPKLLYAVRRPKTS